MNMKKHEIKKLHFLIQKAEPDSTMKTVYLALLSSCILAETFNSIVFNYP